MSATPTRKASSRPSSQATTPLSPGFGRGAAVLDPWGLSHWGLMGGELMRLWVDRMSLGQQAGQSLLDVQLQCWRELQAAVAQAAGQGGDQVMGPRWWGLAGGSLHVMPDSAGPALCPPDDLTPASLARSAIGAWLAWMAAWSTAVRHELQDLEESRSGGT